MFASDVIDVSSTHALSIVAAVEAISVHVTSYVVDHQQRSDETSGANTMEWPLVSIPHFEAKGQLFLQESGATLLSFSPLVHRKDKAMWENYSQTHQGWVQEGLDYQYYTQSLLLPSNNPPETSVMDVKPIAIPITPYVYFHGSHGNPVPEPEADENFDDKSDLLAVTWQMAPAPNDPDLVNYNALSTADFRRSFQGMIDTNHAIISEVMDFTSDTSIGNPQSCLLHPVYDQIMAVDEFGETLTKKMVGYISATIPWHVYFNNLLPNGVSGIVLVLSNTCEQEYTYKLDGHQVTFMGTGDLHDTAFDDLVVSAPFYAHDDEMEKNDESLSQCRYSVHLYPSQEFESVYNTRRPGYYSTVVIVISFLAAAVFFLYDRLVQNRQKKVLESATRASDLVESLFPATVRKRLMEDAAAHTDTMDESCQNMTADSDHNNRSATMNPRKAMKRAMKRHSARFSGSNSHEPASRFLGRSSFQHGSPASDGRSVAANTALASQIIVEDGSEGDEDERLIRSTQKKPIADFFAQATIFFADLVGFTAWSSVREPSQVFRLLETLYNGFDIIARRRGVFKVETIGDCYMAGTLTFSLSLSHGFLPSILSKGLPSLLFCKFV
jgi:Adenylate and Guanylate cyclase catalytic domain